MRQFNLSLGLLLASYCFAAPQQQPRPNNRSLDDLINDIFGDDQVRGYNEVDKFSSFTIAAQKKAEEPKDVGIAINEIFHGGSNGGPQNPTLVLGPGISPVNPITPETPKACECVPRYRCQNGTIIQNGLGMIDKRSGCDNYENEQGTTSSAGECENYLEVCCKPPNVINTTSPPVQDPIVRNGCGLRHTGGVGFRITSDKNEAQFGEFPWMVAILREEKINLQTTGQFTNTYQCGGALIHSRAVLTAAHCVVGRQANHLKVRAGEWDIQTSKEIFSHQDRGVSEIIIHEEFNSGSLSNDFAIIILSEPVDFAENIDVVCLPRHSDQFDFSRCVASGWGKNLFGQAGHYQVVLKKVELPIVPRDTCQNSLRTTRLGGFFVLERSFICAGGEPGTDTCKGDGGSPLVCPLQHEPSRYAQAGIVAWGIGCGKNGIPGVYANVAYARRWIDEKMAYKNLNTSIYTY